MEIIVINMTKKKLPESLALTMTIISFIVVMVLFVSSLAGFTGAWFASESEVEPNVFIVEIPEAKTDSAWSDGELFHGATFRYFTYIKGSGSPVKGKIVIGSDSSDVIGIITVTDNGQYLNVNFEIDQDKTITIDTIHLYASVKPPEQMAVEKFGIWNQSFSEPVKTFQFVLGKIESSRNGNNISTTLFDGIVNGSIIYIAAHLDVFDNR
jgi:hypothetical protein